MRTILTTITALSVISLIGCNKLSRDDTNANALSDTDTTEGSQAISPDLADSDEAKVNDSLASVQLNQSRQDKSDSTFVQTEVVQIDTIGSKVAYDINRRTIEQVDTVGATTTYEVRRRVIKKTVMVDTIIETVNKAENVAYEKGDYQAVNEEVKKDTVTEEVSMEEAQEINDRQNATASDNNPSNNRTDQLESKTTVQSVKNDSTINMRNDVESVRSEATDSTNVETESANESDVQDTTSFSRENPTRTNQEDTTSSDNINN